MTELVLEVTVLLALTLCGTLSFRLRFLHRETVGVELAPVRGIVRNLGGWINVVSEERAGTTFEVLFPYVGDFQVGRARAKGSLV